MIWRKPPEPIDREEWKRFDRSERLKHVAERLRQRGKPRREMVMKTLSRPEKVYVQYLLAHDADCELDRDEYIKQFNLTSPVVAAPKVLEPTPDFARTWSQVLLHGLVGR